ncbi:hypothetical protein OROGR_010562 [Orobanche gracilis]
MILLSKNLNPAFATGAFIIPVSLYFALKNFVFKPYYVKREKQKALENIGKTQIQLFDFSKESAYKLVTQCCQMLSEVLQARAAAKKAQQLLQNVANRKSNKQRVMSGLVVVKAVYGNHRALMNRLFFEETEDEVASQIIDVTVPLNFLVNDSGQLKLHGGVKKSGIMGFCDPCPRETKQLHVEYTYCGTRYEVTVDDHEELLIPQERHKV